MDTSPRATGRHVRRRTNRWAIGLLSLEITIFVWGTIVFVRSPAASYPREMRDHYCGQPGHLDETIADLWAPYIALVIVGVFTAAMLANTGTRRWRRRAARLGLGLVVLTFPGCAALGVAMDCGL